MKTIFALILISGAVTAQDAVAERFKLVRTAIEARLRLGDALREKGDLDGAIRIYREAISLYDRSQETRRAQPAARRGPERAFDDKEIRQAVADGLAWLAAHQSEDGRWDSDGFMARDPQDDRCDGPGGALYDVGVSSLALLAFLGAGHTDRGEASKNKYAKTVRNSLRFLLIHQDDQGCFGSRHSQHFIYNHGLAAQAMSEAFGMTRNPRYKKPAQAALNFIARARNPYLAWRYEPRGGENDTSVTAWMILATWAGKFAGLDTDPDAIEGARQWIDKMTEPEFGQVGYNMPGGSVARPQGLQDKFPPEKSQAMTAAGMLVRILNREDPRSSKMIRRAADLCLEHAPVWNSDDGSIDMYYWYFGTRALFEVGGSHWKNWDNHLRSALLSHQHPAGSGARAGSWDPIGPWGNDGGRVYATAINVLSLQVLLRAPHERVFGARDMK